MFAEVTEEKLVGEAFLPPPILNRVKVIKFNQNVRLKPYIDMNRDLKKSKKLF